MKAEQYRRWFEYEKDAHEKTVASFGTVPDERRRDPSFAKAVALLAHIAAARMLWLHRFGVTETGPTTFEELFPTGVTLEEAARGVREMESTWTSYLDTLDEREAERTFEYRSTEGDRYRNRIEDQLAQLFGHSFYHRGQIAAIVRSLGGTPAETDFVLWTRERISD